MFNNNDNDDTAQTNAEKEVAHIFRYKLREGNEHNVNTINVGSCNHFAHANIITDSYQSFLVQKKQSMNEDQPKTHKFVREKITMILHRFRVVCTVQTRKWSDLKKKEM